MTVRTESQEVTQVSAAADGEGNIRKGESTFIQPGDSCCLVTKDLHMQAESDHVQMDECGMHVPVHVPDTVLCVQSYR